MTEGRAPIVNLLVLAFLLAVGLSLAPWLVGVVMDLFAIVFGSVTGWDLGLGFVENSLALWPGGEVVAVVVLDQRASMPALASSLLQAVIVTFLRALVPPLFVRNSDFSVRRLFLIGMVDSVVTCIIAVAVGWLFVFWFNDMFVGVVGVLAHVVAWLGGLAILGASVLGVLGGRPGLAFSMITGLGRFALTTFALVFWSIHSIAGAFTVAACIVGCSVLALVDGRRSSYW